MANRLKIAAFACLLPWMSSCETSGPVGTQGGPIVLNEHPTEEALLMEAMQGNVPQEFMPALLAITTAVKEGANETARGTLRALLRRAPTGYTLELARAFERILDGRERVGWLKLRLEAHEHPERAGHYDLELVLSQNGEQELHYRAGGARLMVSQVAVSPDGADQKGSRRDAVPFPEEVTLIRGVEQRFPVAEMELEIPRGVLAFSSRFRLELMPGEFRMEDGRYLPAQSVEQPALEVVRLAGAVPNATVEPSELVDYVRAGKLYVPALMERAVRIDPARRAEALDLLTPLVAEANVVDLEMLVPALRWLAGTSGPGGSPEAWRKYMESRRARAERDGRNSTSGLSLPRS